MKVTIVGAGPAGCSAAIAAVVQGADVTLHEKSRFPRHKVCGEFLSPEIVPLLEKLGIWDDVQRLNPARFDRLELHFANHTKRARFTERPYGLSRYHLDRLMVDRVLRLGVRLLSTASPAEEPLVLAHGRKSASKRSADRVFGFKAHFRGPVSDVMELYFFHGGYVGVNRIEDRITNVCGLATEEVLRQHHFDPDALIASVPALHDRIRPLSRAMDWLHAGPLVYRSSWRELPVAHTYFAGDALGFVDPFTGTGILSAVLTGWLAGFHAASGASAEVHLAACRKALGRAYFVSAAFRRMLSTPLAGPLSRIVPANLLVALTRPRIYT